MLKCNSTKIPEHSVKLEIISVSTYITIVTIKITQTGVLLVYYYRFFKSKNCKITYTRLHPILIGILIKSQNLLHTCYYCYFFFFFAKTI